MLKVDLAYAESSLQGEAICGDGMCSSWQRQTLRILHADGIGHGASAREIVCRLQERFAWICNRSRDLIGIGDCLQELHSCLRAEPGICQAAVAIVDIHADTGCIDVLSVGNVQAHHLASDGSVSFPCLNGMIGGRLPSTLPLHGIAAASPALLLIHSDGISVRPVLGYLETMVRDGAHAERSSESIARTVIQRFGKHSDDASCTVVGLQRVEPA